MGSAACYYLAKSGAKVQGIEQFKIGHDHGSSHGESRLIRKAYFEHPDYVPLLHRSYELWEDLEIAFFEHIDKRKSKIKKLLHKNGLVIYGNPSESVIYQGVLRSAKLYDLQIETFTYEEALKRFPYYHPPENFSAVFEEQAGFLEVENCVKAFASEAKRAGASIAENESVKSWRRVGDGYEVETKNETYYADKLIVTAGAWSGSVLSELKLPLKVHRTALVWYPCPDELSVRKGLPCFGVDVEKRFFYGVPKISGFGLKVGEHTPGQILNDPSENSDEPASEDIERTTAFVQKFTGDKVGEHGKHVKCMYTMTPDEHFIVDSHPDPKMEDFFFAAGFSGHGFKFSPVIGKALTDLALTGETSKDVDFLKLARFAKK